jgi:hypothetical protein
MTLYLISPSVSLFLCVTQLFLMVAGQYDLTDEMQLALVTQLARIDADADRAVATSLGAALLVHWG